MADACEEEVKLADGFALLLDVLLRVIDLYQLPFELHLVAHQLVSLPRDLFLGRVKRILQHTLDLFRHDLCILLDMFHLLLNVVELLVDHALLLIEVLVILINLLDILVVDLIYQTVSLTEVLCAQIMLLLLLGDVEDAHRSPRLLIEVLVAHVRVTLTQAEHASDQVLIERLDALLLLIQAILYVHQVVAGWLPAQLIELAVDLVLLHHDYLMLLESLMLISIVKVLEMLVAEVDLVLDAVLLGKLGLVVTVGILISIDILQGLL